MNKFFLSLFVSRYDTEMDEYIKLTHNFGRIHDLKWCLEGGFVQSQVSLYTCKAKLAT